MNINRMRAEYMAEISVALAEKGLPANDENIVDVASELHDFLEEFGRHLTAKEALYFVLRKRVR